MFNSMKATTTVIVSNTGLYQNHNMTSIWKNPQKNSFDSIEKSTTSDKTTDASIASNHTKGTSQGSRIKHSAGKGNEKTSALQLHDKDNNDGSIISTETSHKICYGTQDDSRRC
jgi:hypothetical protein